MRVLEFEGENPKYRILRDTAQPVTRIGKDGNEEIVCYSYQIEACRDFGDVKEDDKGGRVTGFHNLSHEGLCWIEEGSSVVEGASVRDNVILVSAKISGEAVLCTGVSVYKTHIKEGRYEGAYTISFPVSSPNELTIYDGVLEDARTVNSVVAHTSKNLWSFESKNFKSDKALKKYFAKRGYKHFSRMKALMKFHRKMFNIEE